MKLAYLAFTAKGKALADELATALGGTAMRCNQSLSLEAWTSAQFADVGGLVFVGAAGIAVRAIAPHLKHKATDPAVVVVDECGHFAVPILSGHLGGANDLARQIARVCGAVPVITTATDANGIFAVDEWAKRQGCLVLNPGQIKQVSSLLLAGGTVRVRSAWPIAGTPPAGVAVTEDDFCQVRLDLLGGDPDALCLVPPLAVLGVGCRRGISHVALEDALVALLDRAGICVQAICAAATIDRKGDEPALLDFCDAHNWPLSTYTAEQLRQIQGTFTGSAFVQQVTGVDNVCERAAVLASGGTLYCNKLAGNGVTMALALKPYQPDWRWRDE